MESVALPPRLPLVVETSNRGSSTNFDARLVNCYIEVSSQEELYIYKRPGLLPYQLVADSEIGRGVFFWRGAVYSIFGSTLYRNGVSVATGLDTTTGGAVAGNGVYKFDQILGATPKMILGNGVKTYAYTDAGGLTADLHTIDTDYPILVVKGFAYLNGPIYVMDPFAKIWGSLPNSVSASTSWDPLNFIEAQIEPDPAVHMSKQLVYVVAFNSWSTEMFFDAGNPTGSPLAPVQGSKSSYGCANTDSVRKIDDVLFWVCINQEASLQVVMMEQLSVTVISTAPIDRLLQIIDFSVMYSWSLKIDGHSFYVITFKNSNLTLAYDIVQKLWFQWTDFEGNYFPIVDSTYSINGTRVLQHEDNGRLFEASTLAFKDLNDPIQVDIYTPEFDAGTRRRKQLGMMTVIADQIEGSTLEARCSEDGYQTWSQPRLFDLGAKNPMLTNCGTFTKRAYNFRHKKDCFFRIQAVEVQYDLGTL
jgi:hypothetical protein